MDALYRSHGIPNLLFSSGRGIYAYQKCSKVCGETGIICIGFRDPILVRMGVPQIAAHFFVFYFGIVADLTPPVALAAYAGAAIAGANPMKTALQSTKLAIGAFIVPYVFALNPAMLFIDTTAGEVVLICITSLIGIFGVSAALEGYILTNMNVVERIASAAAGLMLIIPGAVTDIAGVVLFAAVVLWQVLKVHQAKAKKAA